MQFWVGICSRVHIVSCFFFFLLSRVLRRALFLFASNKRERQRETERESRQSASKFFCLQIAEYKTVPKALLLRATVNDETSLLTAREREWERENTRGACVSVCVAILYAVYVKPALSTSSHTNTHATERHVGGPKGVEWHCISNWLSVAQRQQQQHATLEESTVAGSTTQLNVDVCDIPIFFFCCFAMFWVPSGTGSTTQRPQFLRQHGNKTEIYTNRMLWCDGGAAHQHKRRKALLLLSLAIAWQTCKRMQLSGKANDWCPYHA